MEHPNFIIENAELAELHRAAATVANTAEPLGPFVGNWWQHYLSEVILRAQREVIDSRTEQLDREKNELAAENARLREQLALVSTRVDSVQAGDTVTIEGKGAYTAGVTETTGGISVTPLEPAPAKETAGNVAGTAGERPNITEPAVPATGSVQEMISASTAGEGSIKTRYDNPATYTARPNPFKRR